LIDRTQRSACEFRFGLLAGRGVHFTPPAANVSRNSRQNLVITVVQQVAAAVQISSVLHRGVARHLFHPARVRMACDAAQRYTAGSDFDPTGGGVLRWQQPPLPTFNETWATFAPLQIAETAGDARSWTIWTDIRPKLMPLESARAIFPAADDNLS
jgi:hypothetical protein